MKLRNTIIYLIGVPGVGKYTVAQCLARITGAKVVDNQLINTPVFSVLGYTGLDAFPFPEEAWYHIGKIHRAVLSVIRDCCAPSDSFIFTNVLDSTVPGDRAWYRRVEGTAEERKAKFFPVHITCNASTLRRRKGTQDRKKRLKDVDLASIPRWLEDFEVLNFKHPHALSLDTTGTTPQAAAEKILKHVVELSSNRVAGRRPEPGGV